MGGRAAISKHHPAPHRHPGARLVHWPLINQNQGNQMDFSFVFQFLLLMEPFRNLFIFFTCTKSQFFTQREQMVRRLGRNASPITGTNRALSWMQKNSNLIAGFVFPILYNYVFLCLCFSPRPAPPNLMLLLEFLSHRNLCRVRDWVLRLWFFWNGVSKTLNVSLSIAPFESPVEVPYLVSWPQVTGTWGKGSQQVDSCEHPANI